MREKQRFTTLSERKVSLQEEKSNVSSRWIAEKRLHFKKSDECPAEQKLGTGALALWDCLCPLLEGKIGLDLKIKL